MRAKFWRKREKQKKQKKQKDETPMPQVNPFPLETPRAVIELRPRPTPTEAELREQLRGAIARRDELAAAADDAKAIADRASVVKNEAAHTVNRLKQGIDAAQQTATQAYARTLSGALREGLELPPATMPSVDSAALTLALTRLSALHAATCGLETEAIAAAAERDRATEIVQVKAHAVVVCIFLRLYNETLAARDTLWRLEETMSGFFLFDEHRQTPEFTSLKEDLRRSLDRVATAIDEDPQLIERHKLTAHGEAINRVNWQRWVNFEKALERDADAEMEPA